MTPELKPAGEWAELLGNREERQRYAGRPALLKELVEAIQSNAIAFARHQALTEAAEKCRSLIRPTWYECVLAIESLRDSKKCP